jgi:hypothetical protein
MIILAELLHGLQESDILAPEGERFPVLAW